MKPFDDLLFYCIPALPSNDIGWTAPTCDVRCQLNLWAGQLYLDKFETYLRLCLLLGISSRANEGEVMGSDRFVPMGSRSGEMAAACLFEESPIPLLKKLFGLRRKGMGYQATHLGKVLNARLLSRDDFEDAMEL